LLHFVARYWLRENNINQYRTKRKQRSTERSAVKYREANIVKRSETNIAQRSEANIAQRSEANIAQNANIPTKIEFYSQKNEYLNLIYYFCARN